MSKFWAFLSFRWHSLVLALYQSSLRSANAECALGQPLSLAVITRNKYSRLDMLNRSFSLFFCHNFHGDPRDHSFWIFSHCGKWILTVLSCRWLVNLGLQDCHSFGWPISSWGFAADSQQIWETCTGIPSENGAPTDKACCGVCKGQSSSQLTITLLKHVSAMFYCTLLF